MARLRRYRLTRLQVHTTDFIATRPHDPMNTRLLDYQTARIQSYKTLSRPYYRASLLPVNTTRNYATLPTATTAHFCITHLYRLLLRLQVRATARVAVVYPLSFFCGSWNRRPTLGIAVLTLASSAPRRPSGGTSSSLLSN